MFIKLPIKIFYLNCRFLTIFKKIVFKQFLETEIWTLTLLYKLLLKTMIQCYMVMYWLDHSESSPSKELSGSWFCVSSSPSNSQSSGHFCRAKTFEPLFLISHQSNLKSFFMSSSHVKHIETRWMGGQGTFPSREASCECVWAQGLTSC